MKLNFSNYIQTFTVSGDSDEYLNVRKDQD
jgi:hypothetical protein